MRATHRRWAIRCLVGLGGLAGCLVALAVWALAPPRPVPVPAAGIRLEDVTLVEPGRGRGPVSRLVVAGDRIAAIAAGPTTTPAGGPDPVATVAPVPVHRGGFVLPGLVDMHVHHPTRILGGHPEFFSLMFLRHGVTTVRDTGSFDGLAFDLRDRIAAARAVGPRMVISGPLIDGRSSWPGAVVVREPGEARRAVRDLAARGVDFIKIYGGLSRACLDAVHEAAIPLRLPVIGHMPREVPFEESRLADVQHLSGVPRFGKPAPGQRGAWIRAWTGLDDERVRFIVETSRAQGMSHTPTLVLLHHVAGLAGYPALRDGGAAGGMPRLYRETFWDPANDFRYRHLEATDWEPYSTMVRKAHEVVSKLREGGVQVLVGTDTLNPFVVPGASLHEELHHLRDAGFGLDEVWEAATRRAGAFLRIQDLGDIRPGAPADLLVFREDPTRDLRALSTLEWVIAAGRPYRVTDLDRELDRHRRHHDHPLRVALIGSVYRVLARWLL